MSREIFDEAVKLDMLDYLTGLSQLVFESDTDRWNAAYEPDQDKIVVYGKFQYKTDLDKRRTILHEAGHRGQYKVDVDTFREFKRCNLNQLSLFIQIANRAHLNDYKETGKIADRAGEIFAESYARYCLDLFLPAELEVFWRRRIAMG